MNLSLLFCLLPALLLGQNNQNHHVDRYKNDLLTTGDRIHIRFRSRSRKKITMVRYAQYDSSAQCAARVDTLGDGPDSLLLPVVMRLQASFNDERRAAFRRKSIPWERDMIYISLHDSAQAYEGIGASWGAYVIPSSKMGEIKVLSYGEAEKDYPEGHYSSRFTNLLEKHKETLLGVLRWLEQEGMTF